jgi:hypothetical protein
MNNTNDSQQKWIQVQSKKTQQKLKALSRQSSSKSIIENNKVVKSFTVSNVNLDHQEYFFKSNWDFTMGIFEQSLKEINRILINPPIGFAVDSRDLKKFREKLLQGLEVLEKVLTLVTL